MNKKNIDIKISMEDVPYNLSDWVHEAVNQTVFEAVIIHNISNRLEEAGIEVLNIRKCDSKSPIQPFVIIDIAPGFAIYFEHIGLYSNYTMRIELQLLSSYKNTPPTELYHITFRSKFGEPLKILNTHILGISQYIATHEMLGDELSEKAKTIIDVIKNYIQKFPEYDIITM